MDGFDDLLEPSRRALEENPFEDPFSKRSSSPDPWSSYSHPIVTTFGQSESLNTEPEPTSGTTPTGSFVTADQDDRSDHANLSGTSDPLDAAASDTDEEQIDHSNARTPGFLESLPPGFSEIETIRPTLPEELEPTIPAPAFLEPEPSHSRASTSTLAVSSSSSPSVVSRTPSAGAFARATSPLESPASLSVGRSFASLTLGGETAGGWQEPSTQKSATQELSEDSDDDKPIGQTIRQSESSVPVPTSPTTSTSRAENILQPLFVISVEDPQKVGDPIRSFTMYTVHTRTTSPLFQKSSFSVLRRYSDFLWLYETLSVNNPGVVVPPAPEKSPFGRFDDNFVRQRRLALEKCIQKTANHPVLSKDTDLKMFLESDTFALDIKHRKAEIAQERGGLMASIGQTIAGPRFHETDEWFDKQKAYLDSLESQLRGLVKAIDLVAKNRAELAAATGEFAQMVGDLSLSDVGKQLSFSFSGMAEVERTADDLQRAQSEQDMVIFMSTVDEYARLINSVRLAFNSRVRMYHAWQNADGDVKKVKQAHEKNRAQGRIPPERLGHSLSQIAEAERRCLEAKHEFDHVSKLVKSEVARFERERVEDFKESLHQFLEGMVSRQKELVGAWESYQQMLLKRVGGGGRPPVVHTPA